MSKAHHFVMTYSYDLSDLLRFRLEPYYQHLYDLPIATNPNDLFSTVNLFDGYVTQALVNNGTGENYGIDLSLERSLANKFYYLFSSSFYESNFTAADGQKRPTRWNGRYAFSATGGYEWDRETRKGKQQIFGLNLRGIYRGGLRDMPIDIAASQAAQSTVFVTENGFTDQRPDFYRLDFRFTYKRNRKGYTSTLGLDIQNMLNTKNIGFRYFDTVQDAVVTKFQLGIIPLLSYRMEF